MKIKKDIFALPITGTIPGALGEALTQFIATNVVLEKAVKITEIFFSLYVTSAASVRRNPKFYDVSIQGNAANFPFIERTPLQITPNVNAQVNYNFLYAGFPANTNPVCSFEKLNSIITPQMPFAIFANVYDSFAATDQCNYYLLIKGEFL